MNRALLSVLVLVGVLTLGCSAEPPSPPAGPQAADPAAQNTPIFADDFEQGQPQSWAEGEASQPDGETAQPAE